MENHAVIFRTTIVQKGDRGLVQLYSNKGREYTGAHTHGVFSRFWRAPASFDPKLLARWPLLSPLTEVLGRSNLPEPPTTHSLHPKHVVLSQSSEVQAYTDPLICFRSQGATNLLPKAQKLRLVQMHLPISGAKLPGLCNITAASS